MKPVLKINETEEEEINESENVQQKINVVMLHAKISHNVNLSILLLWEVSCLLYTSPSPRD